MLVNRSKKMCSLERVETQLIVATDLDDSRGCCEYRAQLMGVTGNSEVPKTSQAKVLYLLKALK